MAAWASRPRGSVGRPRTAPGGPARPADWRGGMTRGERPRRRSAPPRTRPGLRRGPDEFSWLRPGRRAALRRGTRPRRGPAQPRGWWQSVALVHILVVVLRADPSAHLEWSAARRRT